MRIISSGLQKEEHQDRFGLRRYQIGEINEVFALEFSVIVPALNEETYIEACLKSISRQTLPRNSYEIIVSDGGSNDRTVEISRKYADRVIVSKKRGIWWGRNQGAKFSKGKYLVFIDADTRIKEDYLEIVHEHLESGVVGLTTAYKIDRMDLKTKIFEYISCCYLWLNSEIDNASLVGINLCVPRAVFMKVGGFKDYALEDAAFGRELRKEGQTCFLMQQLVVTSARRLEAYGAIGLCRYYFELGLIDGGNIGNLYISKYMKYQRYMPIRIIGRPQGGGKYENSKALSTHIRRIEKKILERACSRREAKRTLLKPMALKRFNQIQKENQREHQNSICRCA